VVECAAVRCSRRWFYHRAGAFVVVVALAGCATQPDDEATDSPPESGEVGVFDLEVGDCLADFQDATQMSRVEAAPCSEPHSDEIYASGSLPESGDFPGAEAVESAAQDICLRHYQPFVGLPYEDSVLDIGYLTPTEDSWSDGDRAVLCTIFDPLQEVVGSLRGAQR
jgi:Septum formation